MDPLALHRPEERKVVGGDVDGSSPRALDPRSGQARQEATQTLLRSRGRRVVRGEARVHPAAKSDRARAATHQHAPVGGGAEVVQEHAPVEDRLAARPADLLEQRRNRLREDDVRAEVRHVARDRPPPGRRGVDRDDDLRSANGATRRRDVSVTNAQRRRVLVQVDACVHRRAT